MTLDEQFDAEVTRLAKVPKQPPKVQLALYGLFKQVKLGDVTGKRPGALDLRGRAKYDAWAACQGMSHDEAVLGYLAIAGKL
jgi:acyl-CoA-binding protein